MSSPGSSHHFAMASFGQTSGVVGLFLPLGSALSSSGSGASQLCASCFQPPLQPISKCATSLLWCFLSVFSTISLTSACKEHNTGGHVYFRVGFSFVFRDVSKSLVPSCCSNGALVNPSPHLFSPSSPCSPGAPLPCFFPPYYDAPPSSRSPALFP